MHLACRESVPGCWHSNLKHTLRGIEVEQSGDTTAGFCWNPCRNGNSIGPGADKAQRSQGRRSFLLLKQQLGWNHSPQINLVHYNLIVRLTHTSTPKLCPGTQRLGSLGGLFQPQGSCDSPHLSGYWFNYILDRLVGHKGPGFLGVLTDKSNPRDWGNPSFRWSVQKTPTSGKHSLLTVPAKGIPNSCPLPRELLVPHTGNGSGITNFHIHIKSTVGHTENASS